MDYEKKYKEALSRAKSFELPEYKNIMASIFPELQESKDEKIRNALIRFHKSTIDIDGIKGTDILAWIEKQGNVDTVSYEVAENEKREFVGYGFLKCKGDFLSFKEGENYWLEYVGKDNYNVRSDNLLGQTFHITPQQLYTVFRPTTWLEKQGKSIKIKKGKNYLCTKTHKYAGLEWIEGIKYYSPEDYALVNQGCICHCPEYSKEKHNNFFKEVEYDGCLEVEDAEQKPTSDTMYEVKDGDSLSVNGEPFDYEKATITQKDFAPQQEPKFKVKYAGNEYNVFEIRNINGIKYYGIEDEPNHIDYIKADSCKKVDGYSIKENGSPYPINPETFAGQKPAWSDEDEKMYRMCIDAVEYYHTPEDESAIREWFKSLKNRVQPQPKKWSEEDEKIANDLIAGFLSSEKIHHLAHASKEIADWLKSLKDRIGG